MSKAMKESPVLYVARCPIVGCNFAASTEDMRIGALLYLDRHFHRDHTEGDYEYVQA